MSEFQASTLSQKGRYLCFSRQHVIRTALLRNAVQAHGVPARCQPARSPKAIISYDSSLGDEGMLRDAPNDLAWISISMVALTL